ncbi:Phytanoyl-CoA dioxygenase [Balamuthia mandrillaris]
MEAEKKEEEAQRQLLRLAFVGREACCYLPFPSEQADELEDSTALYQAGDYETLRQRLQADGYLFLRGVVPSEHVTSALRGVLEYLQSKGALEDGQDIMKAVINSSSTASSDQGKLDGSTELTKTDAMKRVLEAKELRSFFEGLMGGEVRTYDYKWLRAVATGGYTGAHMDSVYMGRGTKNLLTCWIPFMDISLEKGGLAVLQGSNSLPSFERVRNTYGAIDVDKDDIRGTGWYTENPLEVLSFGGRWKTASFRPGDIVVFTTHTFHGSLLNTTNEYRISCDVRWQLASEPVDERWIGERPVGHTKFLHRHDPQLYPRTMEQAKREWGLL